MFRNDLVLLVFAPILILTGIGGFFIPEDMALMSGAVPYNIFHIVFGIIGLVIWYVGTTYWAAMFNIGFGLIDIYQAFASYLKLPPTDAFQYTIADDVLHVVIGIFLCVVGFSVRTSDHDA